MDKVTGYINSRKEQYVEELKDFLRIPSVSTLPEHKKDLKAAADFVASKLKEAGLENVKLINTEGHPLVYGDWLHANNKPTVLIYGHYDVQPVDPLHLWDSPPFEPVIKNDADPHNKGKHDIDKKISDRMKEFKSLQETF